MDTIEILTSLTEHVKKYSGDALKSVKRNSHMNEYNGEGVSQETVDALLVDFINSYAAKFGIDYALYTDDLK